MPEIRSYDSAHLYCGIVWGAEVHDVGAVDDVGRIVLRKRVQSDPAGLTHLLTLLARAGDSPHHPIPLAAEVDRRLWVRALRSAGRPIYSIDALASARYHTSHAVSAAKSANSGPVLLANIVRTNQAALRPLPPYTGPPDALGALARDLQSAVWLRQQLENRIVDLLMDFYPAAIAAFADPLQGGLVRRDARMLLSVAPNPNRAAALTTSRLRHLLRNAGRQRHVDRDAERLRQVFTATYPQQPTHAETAMGIRLAGQLAQLEAACITVDRLIEQATAQFG